MKVLVTGVSGFLGGRVAGALAAAGHDVRGLVRDPARWGGRPDGAEEAVGDVTEPDTLRAAVEGCDAIVHAAAMVKMWVRDRRAFDRVNVQGFGNVLEAARVASARLLYTSSFLALGPTDGAEHDEDTPRSSETFYTDYERTKWTADRMARSVPDDVDIVRLYPGVVFGPGALTDGNYIVQLLRQHARGKLPGVLGRDDLRQCFAYVDDVAAGFVAALTVAPPGAGYILGGENRTVRDLFEVFERCTGIRPPRRTIPFWLASAIGKIQRWRAELTGIEPELTDEVVGVYRHEWAYTSARAERDLGYRITPFEDALASTVAWLRDTGELPGATG